MSRAFTPHLAPHLAPHLGLAAALALAAGLLPLAGCRQREGTFTRPSPSLSRMQVQKRAEADQPSGVFPDGRVDQPPPEGAVAYDSAPAGPRSTGAGAGGEPLDRFPMELTRPMLDRGRDRFDVFCAPCHGASGDGHSFVASKMTQRPPPSLHEERIRALSPGQLYRVVREGYGLMPSYEAQLPVDDRWAVVAYVKALELSRWAEVARLPDDLRAQVERGAP